MKTLRMLPLAVLVSATLAGCYTTPSRDATLDQARTDYRSAQADPTVSQYAANELQLAADALDQASSAASKSSDAAQVSHLAYMARQRVAIARALASQRASDAEVLRASAGREQMRLSARTDEADEAHRRAAAASRQAEVSDQRAAAARQDTDAAQASNQALLAQLKALNATQTARGVVIAFGDVLFDTDASRLHAEGLRAIDQLAAVLAQHPLRRVLVEGFTDSLGSQSHNQRLSGLRAEAVKSALVQAGVAPSRVSAQAHGEAFPVASNGSAQGRSLNRRVEIVLSDDKGIIAPR
jgi:outer membrane protein OmpA-like peptidoglycan-associated protein